MKEGDRMFYGFSGLPFAVCKIHNELYPAMFDCNKCKNKITLSKEGWI